MSEPIARPKHLDQDTLIYAARLLRHMASNRFSTFGPTDARGAAIWDCAAWLTEECGKDQ